MPEETRSTEEIERSIHGTRQRIEDRFTELGRRLHARTDSVPAWAVGAGALALLFLLRRPLLRIVQSAAMMSAPVVVPLLVGKVVDRLRRDGAYRASNAFQETESYSGQASFGEAALGEGRTWREPSSAL